MEVAQRQGGNRLAVAHVTQTVTAAITGCGLCRRGGIRCHLVPGMCHCGHALTRRQGGCASDCGHGRAGRSDSSQALAPISEYQQQDQQSANSFHVFDYSPFRCRISAGICAEKIAGLNCPGGERKKPDWIKKTCDSPRRWPLGDYPRCPPTTQRLPCACRLYKEVNAHGQQRIRAMQCDYAQPTHPPVY